MTPARYIEVLQFRTTHCYKNAYAVADLEIILFSYAHTAVAAWGVQGIIAKAPLTGLLKYPVVDLAQREKTLTKCVLLGCWVEYQADNIQMHNGDELRKGPRC